MLRVTTLCVFVCLASFAFAQTSSSDSAHPSSPVQVVYAIDGSTLSTYNVDSHTLQATQVGTTTLAQSVYPTLTTSPNGHTIYYTAYQNISQQGERLYVYSTNTSGVPNGPPIQSLGAQGVYSLQVSPAGKFLFLVHQGPTGAQFTPYAIVRFVVDPNTGKISQGVTEAKYELDSGTGGSQSCSLSIFGMNATGTKLYDEIFCSYHGGASATYNERTVDPQTGALGPDQQVYSWNNSYGGGEQVQFVKSLVFDSVTPNDYQQDINVVNVYPLKPNVTTPLIQCTGSMLADCATDINTVHPSAEYIFMFNPQQPNTDVNKVDLTLKQIVATGSTIPYEVQQFSPDGTIAYGVNDINGALTIEIYGFNVATASVTQGGTISVPSDLDSWWAVERR
jgi:hypothetical protein